MAAALALSREHLEVVAKLFRVLSEPTRLEILQTLNNRPHSVNELVELLGAKQANVSKQLGILFDAGLLGRDRAKSQVLYSIKEPIIFDLCDLVCQKLQRDAERQIEALKGGGWKVEANKKRRDG